MTSKKSQEMSIQTVVVLILIMIVLVVVISFSIPQLTNLLGGISEVGTDVSEQSGDSSAYKCISLNINGCETDGTCASIKTKEACLNKVYGENSVACCDWKLTLN